VLFKRIYEDSALGQLPQDRMLKLAANYESEQTELDAQIAKAQNSLNELSECEADLTTFMELVRKHLRIRRLSAEIIHSFIDHITVHQAEKTGDRWQQRIDVFYNCISNLHIPDEEAPAKSRETTLLTRKGVTISHASTIKAS